MGVGECYDGSEAGEWIAVCLSASVVVAPVDLASGVDKPRVMGKGEDDRLALASTADARCGPAALAVLRGRLAFARAGGGVGVVGVHAGVPGNREVVEHEAGTAELRAVVGE